MLKMEYFQDGMNYWDITSLFLGLITLALLAMDSVLEKQFDFKSTKSDVVRTLRAMSLFSTWFSTFHWFEGTEKLFFVLTVMHANIKTLLDFVILYAFLLATFAFTFHELLRTDNYIIKGSFESIPGSLLAGLDMTLGNFDSETFQRDPVHQQNGENDRHWSRYLAFLLFVAFMVIVSIIMMNLLIAGEEGCRFIFD